MGGGSDFIAPIIIMASAFALQPEILAFVGEASAELTGEALISTGTELVTEGSALAAEAAGTALETAVAPTIAAQSITGAISGGLGALAGGGNIGQGILTGGLGGAVGGAFTASGAGTGLRQGIQSLTGADVQTAKALATGAQRFASGTGMGILSGKPVGQAALGGALGAGVGATFDAMLSGMQPSNRVEAVGQDIARRAGQRYAEAGIMNLLRAPTGERVQEAPPVTAGPGSTALGQAAAVSPDLGYAPGGPVLGASETEKARRPVWNVKSLRTAQADQTDTAQES